MYICTRRIYGWVDGYRSCGFTGGKTGREGKRKINDFFCHRFLVEIKMSEERLLI